MASASCASTVVGQRHHMARSSSKLTGKSRVAASSRRGRAMRTVTMSYTDAQEAADAAAAGTLKVRDDLPEVLVAGGGIAGLITALALQRKGIKVKVFEKVKEYKLFGGPIQLQCNAQGALDSIAPDVGKFDVDDHMR